MKLYKTKAQKFSGSDFREVHEKAKSVYILRKKKTKRRVYVRSAYFNKEKIFLDLFWQHLFNKKNWRDRMRRLKYFGCGIELIQKSRFEPKSKENPNKHSEILHRFGGITKGNELFYVQIKEDKRTGQKFFISIYQAET
jgi:hypothetical protein